MHSGHVLQMDFVFQCRWNAPIAVPAAPHPAALDHDAETTRERRERARPRLILPAETRKERTPRRTDQ